MLKIPSPPPSHPNTKSGYLGAQRDFKKFERMVNEAIVTAQLNLTKPENKQKLLNVNAEDGNKLFTENQLVNFKDYLEAEMPFEQALSLATGNPATSLDTHIKNQDPILKDNIKKMERAKKVADNIFKSLSADVQQQIRADEIKNSSSLGASSSSSFFPPPLLRAGAVRALVSKSVTIRVEPPTTDFTSNK